MRRFLLLCALVFCFQPCHLKAQSFTLSAYLLDKNTNEPIPYANIVLSQKKLGQISNLEGFFRFSGLTQNDSLEISFIGYETLKFKVYESIGDTIYMAPANKLLPEAIIYADDLFLYELIAKAKETKTKKLRQAKTYYALDTWANNTKIESLECYYNGTYKSYDLAFLELKNGRLAMAPFENRFFISSETSKALNLLKLFDDNSYFPKQPLQLSRKKIEKDYNLQLTRKNKKAYLEQIYSFSP